MSARVGALNESEVGKIRKCSANAISRRISDTVQDRKRLLLTWMTLNGHYALRFKMHCLH